jgi:hypothetical protein
VRGWSAIDGREKKGKGVWLQRREAKGKEANRDGGITGEKKEETERKKEVKGRDSGNGLQYGE